MTSLSGAQDSQKFPVHISTASQRGPCIAIGMVWLQDVPVTWRQWGWGACSCLGSSGSMLAGFKVDTAEVLDGASAEGAQGGGQSSGTQLVGALEADLQHTTLPSASHLYSVPRLCPDTSLLMKDGSRCKSHPATASY